MWTNNFYGHYYPNKFPQQRPMMIPQQRPMMIPQQRPVIPVQYPYYPPMNTSSMNSLMSIHVRNPCIHPLPVCNPSMNFIGPKQQHPLISPMVNQVYRHHHRPHNVMNFERCIQERQYEHKQQPISLQMNDHTLVTDTSSTKKTTRSRRRSDSDKTTSSSRTTTSSDTTAKTTTSSDTTANELQCRKCNSFIKKTKMFYLNKKENVFCIKCFEPGMKGLHGSFCHEFSRNNCDKKATWGYVGEGKVLTCQEHRLDKMINVNVKTCHFIDKETKKRCKKRGIVCTKD